MTSDWVWWNAANQTSPVLSLVTYYIPQTSRHASCTAVHLPHLSLLPLPTTLLFVHSPKGVATMAKLTSFAVALPLTAIHIAFLASCFHVQAQAQTCYYPNGDTSPNDSPCSTQSGACCPLNWECLSNGLCYLEQEDYYERHSCTDQNWDDQNCPNICTYGEQFESFVLDQSRQC